MPENTQKSSIAPASINSREMPLAATGLNSAITDGSAVSDPAGFRMVLVSFLAAGIGLIAGLIAFALYRLIGLFTNIVFYHRLSADFTSVRYHHLGLWVILMPVVGGIIDELWWPAIGALGLGIIGYFVPRVLGVGYDTISDILNGQLVLKLLIVVMLAKAVALVISLGSGTSGGLLAPMFMSSAALGGHLQSASTNFFLQCPCLRGPSLWSQWARCSGPLRGPHLPSSFWLLKSPAITTPYCP